MSTATPRATPQPRLGPEQIRRLRSDLGWTVDQRDRRNLADADIARLVQAVDRRYRHGGDRRGEDFKRPAGRLKDAVPTDSRISTAQLLGTSRNKVTKTRLLIDHAPEELREVEAGRKSLNAA